MQSFDRPSNHPAEARSPGQPTSRGVIRSVTHAHHPIGSVLELVHPFQVFGFFKSFVHHVTNAV